jgi:hypothetical protein
VKAVSRKGAKEDAKAQAKSPFFASSCAPLRGKAFDLKYFSHSCHYSVAVSLIQPFPTAKEL